MKVLVTGSRGFIGTSLCEVLLEKDHTVFGFDRYNPSYGVQTNIPMLYGDITYYHSIRRAIEAAEPDAVIHLAAYSTADPLGFELFDETLDVNMKGTANVAEAAKNVMGNQLKVFLSASTSEVYGNQESFPLREEMKLNPAGPYQVAKIGAEYYLRYLHEVFDFPVMILRPFNTYGLKPRRTVVESIINQMLTKDKCHLGNPDPIRDFVYIDDHVNAYMACLDRIRPGEIFNVCTGIPVSIATLADMIRYKTGFQGEIFWHKQPPRPCDIGTLEGTYEKAEKILGWTPKISLERGLPKCVEHFRKHPF